MKGYEYLSFSENISKNIIKNISENLSHKYNQKILDHAIQFATDELKTVSTGDLIGNKIADKIMQSSRTSPNNSSETVVKEAKHNGHDKEILKERYRSPEKRLFDNLRL